MRRSSACAGSPAASGSPPSSGASVTLKRWRRLSAPPPPGARSPASAFPRTRRSPPRCRRSSATSPWAEGQPRSARTSRSSCRTCWRAGSSRAGSSTGPSGSTGCPTATRRWTTGRRSRSWCGRDRPWDRRAAHDARDRGGPIHRRGPPRSPLRSLDDSPGDRMNPTYDFHDRVAVITGAGSGMGLATARAFAESGAAVVLANRDELTLRTAAAELTSADRQALDVVCDVSEEEQVAAVVERTVASFGRLDFAFNNAGIQAPPTDAADESAEIFDRVNAINLRGVWACMKHELRPLRAQGSGAIVNCSSLGGLVGLPGRAAYHASKHGVIGLTRSAALEYAPRGVRINAVCPGTIETPMVTRMIAAGDLDADEAAANQPIGRLGTAEEMAAAVLWLCSPAASFVVGVALPVDGGYTAR